jgi:hypothetical protein
MKSDPGRVFRIAAILIRISVLLPAVLRLLEASETALQADTWASPILNYKAIPLCEALIALLCIVPYPAWLVKRGVFVLPFIVLASLFLLRHQLLPFYYADPSLNKYSAEQLAFGAAKARPVGSGYTAQQRQDGKLLWAVHKPDYELWIIILNYVYTAPILLFVLRMMALRSTQSSRSVKGGKAL